jgi:hypothetical protein
MKGTIDKEWICEKGKIKLTRQSSAKVFVNPGSLFPRFFAIEISAGSAEAQHWWIRKDKIQQQSEKRSELNETIRKKQISF